MRRNRRVTEILFAHKMNLEWLKWIPTPLLGRGRCPSLVWHQRIPKFDFRMYSTELFCSIRQEVGALEPWSCDGSFKKAVLCCGIQQKMWELPKVALSYGGGRLKSGSVAFEWDCVKTFKDRSRQYGRYSNQGLSITSQWNVRSPDTVDPTKT